MEHLPIFLDVAGKRVLVVGGSDIAARKARLLVKAGARAVVVTAAAQDEKGCEELETMAARGDVKLLRRAFTAADLDGCVLAFVATDRHDLQVAVADAARLAGIPVNVVDNKPLCTFIMPAIVDRDPITVAVSSAGTAPVLARSIRENIEAMLPPNLGRLARFADRFRGAVKANFQSGGARRRFWERFFSGPVAASVLDGDELRAGEQMLAAVNRPDLLDSRGMVFIVGAGPGNPDLLTLRALRLMQEADVIVHDRLVSAAILDYARRDCERIDVGKAKGAHGCSQDAINAILVREARAGRRGVRLQDGDPFIFGRGGEERDFLMREGVPVEIVPGITAATGCAAAAGIPLTHRDHAHAMTIVTGHGKEGEPEVDWAALARLGQTLVVYMGATTAGRIAGRLMAHGMDPATPVAVIANGTRREQAVRVGDLSRLGRLAASLERGAPAVLVIGEVARKADAWAAADALRAAAN
jgi:uroporphyrin-III C-methyltransferase / precorrin-2 dehydrogenase / sirohydrochlorin ferrochelatase